MKVMTDKQAELLGQLLRIAHGDNDLVNKAISVAAQFNLHRTGKEVAKLEDVVDYILIYRK
jgi:hypothetical protein